MRGTGEPSLLLCLRQSGAAALLGVLPFATAAEEVDPAFETVTSDQLAQMLGSKDFVALDLATVEGSIRVQRGDETGGMTAYPMFRTPYAFNRMPMLTQG